MEQAGRVLRNATELYIRAIQRCVTVGYERDEIALIMGMPQEVGQIVLDRWLRDL